MPSEGDIEVGGPVEGSDFMAETGPTEAVEVSGGDIPPGPPTGAVDAVLAVEGVAWALGGLLWPEEHVCWGAGEDPPPTTTPALAGRGDGADTKGTDVEETGEGPTLEGVGVPGGTTTRFEADDEVGAGGGGGWLGCWLRARLE